MKVIKKNNPLYPHLICGSDGSIYSLKKNKYLTPSIGGTGYKQTQCIYGKSLTIHFLIATTFLGLPMEGMEINHINGIKTDNRLKNLEWVTRSENLKHKFKAGLDCNKGENGPCSILKENQVLEIRMFLKNKEYTGVELSRIFNVHASTISLIKKRKLWKHI